MYFYVTDFAPSPFKGKLEAGCILEGVGRIGVIRIKHLGDRPLSTVGMQRFQTKNVWIVESAGVNHNYMRMGYGFAMYLAALKYAGYRGAICAAHENIEHGHTSAEARAIWQSDRLRSIPNIIVGDMWAKHPVL